MRILGTVTVNGHKVRVVQNEDGTSQAQRKVCYNKRFQDYGPECETQDHAYFWAFEAVRLWFADDRLLSAVGRESQRRASA